MRSILQTFTLLLLSGECNAWQTPLQRTHLVVSRPSISKAPASSTVLNLSLKVPPDNSKTTDESVDAKTEKYGLEVGLFESLKKKDGGETAKGLLKKYGVAYLATSIPLAIVSFAICYVLVDAGVDVQGLLMKIGIGSETASSDAAEKAGTVAIAYAAHKAASPIRFPPTVLLTPVVAKMIGKEPSTEEGDEN